MDVQVFFYIFCEIISSFLLQQHAVGQYVCSDRGFLAFWVWVLLIAKSYKKSCFKARKISNAANCTVEISPFYSKPSNANWTFWYGLLSEIVVHNDTFFKYYTVDKQLS